MLSTLLRRPPTRSSCRCAFCHATLPNTALRRPRPLQLQFDTLTTLFYASIITCAAAADVRAKQRRRERWDVAIEEAKRSLHTRTDKSQVVVPLEQEEYAQDTSEVDGQLGAWELDDEIEQDQDEIFSKDDPFIHQDLSKIIRGSLESQPSTDEPHIRRHASRLRVRRMPSVSERHKGSRTSVYAGAFRKETRKEPWTPKKLATVELSVAMMTVRFALESYKAEPEPRGMFSFLDLAGRLDSSFRNSFSKQLRELEQKQEQLKAREPFDLGDYTHVQYPRYNPQSNINDDDTIELNGALMSIFRRHSQQKIPIQEAMNRISYNLMTAPYAPDVHTFTLLIARLSNMGHIKLADIVVDSFLESHIRPNELIVPTIIAHHSRSGDYEGFQHFLGKLQGKNNGLMLAKPTTPLDGVAAGEGRLVQHGEKTIQLLTLTPRIFQSIIAAYLRFDNLDGATAWYNFMRRKRIEADLPLMVSWLRYQIRQNDWGRLFATWNNIKTKWLSPQSLLSLNHLDYGYGRSAYRMMLVHLKEHKMFQRWQETYKEGLTLGYDMTDLLGPHERLKVYSLDGEDLDRLRTRRKILEHRAHIIASDLRDFEIHAMAARIILSGLSLRHVEEVFKTHAESNKRLFLEWRRERPWLRQRNVPEDSAISSLDGEVTSRRKAMYGNTPWLRRWRAQRKGMSLTAKSEESSFDVRYCETDRNEHDVKVKYTNQHEARSITGTRTSQESERPYERLPHGVVGS